MQRNKAILPHIVDAVLFCANQQIGLRGHRNDKVSFDDTPTANEGNFIAILRILAESNPVLKDHLKAGPNNARYTSKTIQNEIIEISANTA